MLKRRLVDLVDFGLAAEIAVDADFGAGLRAVLGFDPGVAPGVDSSRLGLVAPGVALRVQRDAHGSVEPGCLLLVAVLETSPRKHSFNFGALGYVPR